MKDLYKGFKKVSEDNKLATLEHENGHKLSIAKSGLSRKQLALLKKLPLHQAKPESEIKNPETESELETELMSSAFQGAKEKLQNPQSYQYQEPNALDVSTGIPVFKRAGAEPPEPTNIMQQGGSRKVDINQLPATFAEAALKQIAEPGKYSIETAKSAINEERAQKRATAELAQAPQQPVAPGEKGPGILGATAPTQAQPEPEMEIQGAQPMPSQAEPPAQGVARPSIGVPAQPTPDMRPFADVLADPKANSATKMEAANRWAINTVQKMQTADQEFSQYIKDNPVIVPKLFSNMGAVQTIASSIGLLLGGIGAGLTNGPNQVLQNMNDQIAREVEAQKMAREEKFNLYKMHLDRLKDEHQAALQTENNIRMIAQQQFDEAAGRTGIGPAAREQINLARQANQLQMQQNMMSMVQSKYKQQLMSAAMKSGEGRAEDPSTLVPILVPEAHQKEVFKNIDAAVNTRHMANSIMQAFEEAVKENTVARTGAGLLRTPGSVYALHQHMQPTFADLEGTVRQAAMDNTFKNVTPMPGDTEHKINQKRQALLEYLQSKASASTAKAYGIDLSKYEKTAAYRPWQYEGKIATNKKTGEKMIGRGGKWVKYAE